MANCSMTPVLHHNLFWSSSRVPERIRFFCSIPDRLIGQKDYKGEDLWLNYDLQLFCQSSLCLTIKDTCLFMFIAALTMVVKEWKQPHVPVNK